MGAFHLSRWMPVIVAIVLPATASAQNAVQGWPDLNVSALATVYILDDAGRQTEGTLLGFDAESVVLLVDGMERRFDASRVRRIDRRGDSLRIGAVIGSVVGLVMGLVTSGITDCSGDDPGGSCLGFRAAAFLGSVAIYAGMGTVLDAMKTGRTRLYDASVQTAAGQAVQRAAGRRLALNLSFRW
jgi:hypothetical protein